MKKKVQFLTILSITLSKARFSSLRRLFSSLSWFRVCNRGECQFTSYCQTLTWSVRLSEYARSYNGRSINKVSVFTMNDQTFSSFSNPSSFFMTINFSLFSASDTDFWFTAWKGFVLSDSSRLKDFIVNQIIWDTICYILRDIRQSSVRLPLLPSSPTEI